MSARLTAGVLVSALIRRVEGKGGTAMVLAKGDATAGAVLLVLAERGVVSGLCERTLGMDGAYRWTACGPEDAGERDTYLTRRRERDPDLWVVELDHKDAGRIAGEVLA